MTTTPTDTTTAKSKKALAELLNVSPDALKTAPPEWLELLSQGVIVKVHMSRWRARTSLDFTDLGLHLNGEARLYGDLISLGSKLLLDRATEKALVSIESQARQTPSKHGFTTTFGAFVPATAFAGFMESMNELKARWFAKADEIANDYDRVVMPHVDKFADTARIAYKRANRLQAGQDVDYRYLPEDQYVDRFMNRIRSLIPNAEQIRESFSFDLELSYIPLPSMLAADEAQADRIRLDAIRNRDALDTERQKAAALKMMNQQVLEQARMDKERLVTGFIADIAAQLRALTFEALSDVQKSLNRNGKLHSRSIVQVRNLIDQLTRLNFVNDADIERVIDQLRTIADTPADSRDIGQVQDVIRELRAATRQQLVLLGQERRVDRTDALDTPTLERRDTNRNGAAIVAVPNVTPTLNKGRRSGKERKL